MTSDEYLDRVRSLIPVVRERAVHAERLRRLPDETFKDFQRLGLFRCLQPKRYDGYELDPVTFYQAIMDVGAVCGSSAWILGVVGVHNWHLALFPPQAQEDVWGEDTSRQLSTSLAPTGTVERADGGFRLRGRWSFSSMCDHCQWAVLGGLVPPAAEGDPPDARTFLVPRRDYAVEDNWYVMGLSGTGSKNLVVDDAFVPEYRTHSYRDAFLLKNPGAVVNDGPLYRLPFGLVFPACIAAPAVGVALGALETFREQSRTRLAARDRTRVAEDPFMQFHLAEAAAEVDAARTRLLANFAEMMRLVSAGQEIPLTQRARYRWDAAKAVEWSVRAVDRLFEASGGGGIYLSNPIQRAWRDVHAMRAHAGNNPEKAAAVFGRSEFGLPPLDLRF
ncbi:MAG: 3-hydroxy-9,10-secoandrosta-1,3,5(10)-triene-9,17-dione monooxygenase oxygenase subunit [Candidatus Rokuibacteriota bacterium]